MVSLSATASPIFNYNINNPFSRLDINDILSNSDKLIKVFDRVSSLEFSFFGVGLEPFFDPPRGNINRIKNENGLNITAFESPLSDWFDVFVGVKSFNELMAEIHKKSDQLIGSLGNDTIYGYNQNDFINGRSGNDFLNGGNGNDRVVGGNGNDTIIGGAGDDNLFGGKGKDILRGGFGRDIARYTTSKLGVIVNLNTGRGYAGDSSGDTLVGIEKLFGTEHNDRFVGNGSDNLLNGFGGADTLVGGVGDDILIGGKAGDTLNGGKGKDRYDYRSLQESNIMDIDKIVRLEIGTDRINFPNSINSNDIVSLGSVSNLTAKNIGQTLRGAFPAGHGATFKLRNRTFIAINDNRDNFQASTDSIVEITGFSGSIQDLKIV